MRKNSGFAQDFESLLDLLVADPTPHGFSFILGFFSVTLEALLGSEGLRDAARHWTVHGHGPVVKGLVTTLIGVTGTGPEGLMSKAGQVTSMFERGTSYEWTRQGDREGLMRVRLANPGTASMRPYLEGMLLGALDLCEVKGSCVCVGKDDENRWVEFALRW